MAVHEIVHVVAVGHRLVAAPGTMHVVRAVGAAGMIRRAASGMGVADVQTVFVTVVAVGKMEMPLVEVVDVIAVPYRRMPTLGAVDVVRVFVGGVIVVTHGVWVLLRRGWVRYGLVLARVVSGAPRLVSAPPSAGLERAGPSCAELPSANPACAGSSDEGRSPGSPMFGLRGSGSPAWSRALRISWAM